MTDLPLIPKLRPFGGNQLVITLDAGHPKFGTTTGQYRRHDILLIPYRCDAKRQWNYGHEIVQRFALVSISSANRSRFALTPPPNVEKLYIGVDVEGA
jgi:hypothetical protein